ncbi:hypothetical protein F4860DRAFT_518350 [Xylaria cubensis]|nr:hypothetical protein F4860DRAFT_518350 [Xylaria cubensis]
MSARDMHRGEVEITASLHVTKKKSRIFDAERPPRNRRPIKPPGDINQQPGNNSANGPFGNRGGGDRDEGSGSGGGGSNQGILRRTVDDHKQSLQDTSKWRWNCDECQWQNLSYDYDENCPNCHHRRCSNDTVLVLP